MTRLKTKKGNVCTSVTPKGVKIPQGEELEVAFWPSARHEIQIVSDKDGKRILVVFPDPSWTNNTVHLEIVGENLKAVIKSSS